MGNTTGASGSRHDALALIALLTGNAALALGPWFVRVSDTGPVSAGFWRLFLALPVLFAIAAAARQPLRGFGRVTWLAMAGAGMFFGLDLASWHVGIELTRIGNASLFGNSGSLVVMAAGLYALHRAPRRKEAIAFLLALGGSAVLLGRSLEIGQQTLLGDLFCIAAGLLYAGYILLLQRPRATLGSWAILAWSSAAATPVLLVCALAAGEPFWPQQWWPLIALAGISQVIGQGFLIYALRHLSALVFGLALLTQPAIGVLIGWLVFAETLQPVDLIGMAMVAGGLVMARSAQE